MDGYVPLPPLPPRIDRLNELAYDLWWSWTPRARGVFRDLDYPLWRFTDHNPVLLLHLIEPERLRESTRIVEHGKSQIEAERQQAVLTRLKGLGCRLVVDDSFDRAWRRVGLTLDRIGFTVVDRDRSKGFYFVRYADPEADKKDTGLFSKFAFWKDRTEKPEQYRIVVTEAGDTSAVVVQSPEGAPDKSVTGGRILALLRDQLK